ncbi:MAG: acyl-CoA carboxylase subunit beta [Chloroflexota bacterium]|nr:acyl-CoA carboxylase subunit beta [Chloroflexota bacterium]
MTGREKLQGVEEHRKRLFQGGGPREVERQHDLGKLTARERLEKLFDPGSFQEINLWIRPIRTGFDVDERELAGDGVVTGFGQVHGRPIYAYAHDFTVLGGAQSLGQQHKVAQIMEKALEARVPCVGMIDSGGIKVHDLFGRPARRPILDGDGMGFAYGMFPMVPLNSGVIPQVSLMIGPCYAGSAYSPIMADFVIMRKGTSYMSVASPPLLKAATFIDVTQEEIGGATLHATVTGSCDVLSENDEEAVLSCRKLLTYLPLNNAQKPPVVDTGDDPNRREESLLELVPADLSHPYDMHEVIERVVDKGSLMELQALFAQNIIIGFARLAGHTVGIVANNPAVKGGALDTNTCDKQTRFVRFCDAFGIPLVILVDTPGFLSDAEQEKSREGLLRHAARPTFALCEATVPRVVVHIGKCFGTARLIMGTLRMGVDRVYAWPISQVAKIDPERAVDQIYGKEIEAAPNPQEERERRLQGLLKEYVRFPSHAGEYLMVEDIIDPRETRPILVKTLNLLENKGTPTRPWRKHSLLPR